MLISGHKTNPKTWQTYFIGKQSRVWTTDLSLTDLKKGWIPSIKNQLHPPISVNDSPPERIKH